ncbi:hypothetical protein JVU11DRAFT_2380 [Chiua virens]|nr:hypothetical protein JVU11DRAFT_2380 [Chiua virens]
MDRAPVSDTPSSFVPPPVQRLSRSFSTLGTLPLRSGTCPLPGPNRAPSILDVPSKHSTIFPRLHRLEIADDMATQKKPPLLLLSFSSSSFLDAVATDADSDKPLYAVETVGSSTTVWRSDPWDGSAKIADIRWPKDLPLKGKGRDAAQGPTFQMDSLRWRETSTLLRPSGLGSSRKFHIPHHPHALKWKREGNMYSCTTPSCKGAVATLESFDSADTAPTLKVFETLGSFHQSLPRLDHAGISLSLLDYLFVTALLLVTEPEDWMVLDRNPATLDCRSGDSLNRALPSRASNRQWRKIMYGEPLYPSLKTPAFDKGVVNAGEDADVLDTSEPPQLSASARQWRKIVYGEPLYPSLRSQSADGFDLPPRPSTATSFSSDSAYSPPTPSSGPSSAPSTGFYDGASLFEETENSIARSSIETTRVSSPLAPSSGTLSPMPSSECIPLSAFPVSTLSSARRELPSPPSSYQPPSPSVQPWLHRSSSSPKLRHSAQSPISSSADDQDDPSNGNLLTRMASNVRQLPTPPLRDFIVQSSQSHSRILETRRLSQAHQRSLPPTPESISRSPSAMQQHHGHSFSQVVASQSLPQPRVVRPSTAQPGPSIATQIDGAEDGRRPRHEKDPGQLVNWMRDIARAHRRRVFDDEDHFANPYDSTYDAPPAYNAIDFSTPPHARSPPEGTQRTDSL